MAEPAVSMAAYWSVSECAVLGFIRYDGRSSLTIFDVHFLFAEHDRFQLVCCVHSWLPRTRPPPERDREEGEYLRVVRCSLAWQRREDHAGRTNRRRGSILLSRQIRCCVHRVGRRTSVSRRNHAGRCIFVRGRKSLGAGQFCGHCLHRTSILL